MVLRGCCYRLLTIVSIMVACCAGAVRADERVLIDVPMYKWTHGCTPTAGMMVYGYWDQWGYDNLIPGSSEGYFRGSATLSWVTIQNAIASADHITDYAKYDRGEDYPWYIKPDMSEINPLGAHADNSLADFMKTSRSVYHLEYGATSAEYAASGMTEYAAWKGYAFAVDDHALETPSWDLIVHEIDQGRPLMLNVSANGGTQINHTATAIGYRDTDGIKKVAAIPCRPNLRGSGRGFAA